MSFKRQLLTAASLLIAASFASASDITDITAPRTIDVIVSGSHFQNGATVTFSGTGITPNTTTFNNSGQITVNISIDPAAT